MYKKYKDITLKVFDEVFKDDCYYCTEDYIIDSRILVRVLGWNFCWCDITDDACILYNCDEQLERSLDYSDTYEDDLRCLLIEHVIPDTINELEIHDALKMYDRLKNKGLVEFTHIDVFIIPNTPLSYRWDDKQLVVACGDFKLRQLYGNDPFHNMGFGYGDIDDVISYVETVSTFLRDNKEVLDSYIRFKDSVKQLVQDVTDDLQCKLQDDIEDIIKAYGRG